jgi:hypothetical protein
MLLGTILAWRGTLQDLLSKSRGGLLDIFVDDFYHSRIGVGAEELATQAILIS